MDLSVEIQILKDVEKFLPGFGLAAGVFVGHAPELRVEIAIKVVAYALIFGLPPVHHESGFRVILPALDDGPQAQLHALDVVLLVNHQVFVGGLQDGHEP